MGIDVEPEIDILPVKVDCTEPTLDVVKVTATQSEDNKKTNKEDIAITFSTASLTTCQAPFSGCYRHHLPDLHTNFLRQIHCQVRKSGLREGT